MKWRVVKRSSVSLIAWGKDNGVGISVHDNMTDSYQVSPDFSTENVIILPDGTYWRNLPWAGGYNWRLCPLKSLEFAQRDYPRMRALGLDGNYYLDAISSFYRCNAPGHPTKRRGDFIQAVREIMQLTRDTFGTFSTEIAVGQYLDLVDGVYMEDAHVEFLDMFTDFRRLYIDEVVPFMPVALHNSLRYHMHPYRQIRPEQDALHKLAWGAMPFIEISARNMSGMHGMPKYDDFAVYARETYRLCCVEHVDLVTQDLEDVETFAAGQYLTSYANGTQLFINTGEETANIAGVTVPPISVVRK